MLISEVSASTRGSDFKHNPLPHPITHIRLLEILPLINSQDVAICCRLKDVRLADYDQCYTALSYAWSSNNAGHAITINGQKVTVRNNLYEFLYLYRQKLMTHELPTVFLWIDALCLDYGNTRERNSQVQIMPTIYQKAKIVLAWLEPLPETRDLLGGRSGREKCKSFLEQIRRDLDRPRNLHNDRHLCAKYLPNRLQSTLQFSAEWEALLQLCRHRYWSRLWILLENRYAQNLIFMYGDVLWTWQEFRAPFVLMWYMTEWQLYDSSLTTSFDPAQILYTSAADVIRTRMTFEYPSKFSSAAEFSYTDVATERWDQFSMREPLSDLLQLHRRRLCTDRLDKVYALIGLSNSTLTVDYDRSNIELFCAVLLSLKVSLELDFVSMLAHHLDVSAFQYQQNRRSILADVPSTAAFQTSSDIIGRPCHQVYSVKTISARTELSDVIGSRLGLQKLNYYRVTGRQQIERMRDWDDFPPASSDVPRIHGHTPGTEMPIVDGFDLSDTKFRAAMFLNPSSRSNRRAIFGMISTNGVDDGDILVTDEKMYSGLIVRVSGLSKTWLTVVGVILFARRVTVTTDFSSSMIPGTPTSSIRSSTLSDFCEHTFPTPFTIAGCDGKEHFTLKPHDIQIQSLLSGKSTPNSGRQSRSSTNTTSSTIKSTTSRFRMNDRRLTSKSDRLERILEVIGSHKRRHSK